MICSVCTPSNCASNYRAASSSETTLIWSPARAGKTTREFFADLFSWANPRVCAENEEGELGVLPVVQAVLPVLPDQFFVVPPYKAVD